WPRDWSSDVCSSDLRRRRGHGGISIKNLLLAGDGLIEGGAPASEPALFGGEVLLFIRNIVDEAHEAVKGRQRVALGFRQQEKGVIEIAVRGAGDAVAVLVGCGNRGHRRWRSIMRPRNRRESSRFAGL